DVAAGFNAAGAIAVLHYPADTAVTKSGWLVYSNSFYDGVGADKAYDRATQTGPIIPVNINNGDAARNFVVAFYHANSLGVEWADTPVRFDVQWPAHADQIVIASGLGS